MELERELAYRTKLAVGYLDEARADLELSRWRSCVDNSQLSVENAAKAALVRLGPVGKTHAPSIRIRSALEEKLVPEAEKQAYALLAELAEKLGPGVHVASDYGDEASWLTPLEIFGEEDARSALGLAEQATACLRLLLTP